MRSRLECEVGNLGQAEIFLERLLEVMDLTPPGPSLAYVATAVLIPDVARITGVVDRLDVAASAASTVLSSPSALPGALSSARAGLAMVAVLRGDASAAAEHYRVLESEGTSPLRPITTFSTDHQLGLLAQTMDQLDKAAEHLDDTLI